MTPQTIQAASLVTSELSEETPSPPSGMPPPGRARPPSCSPVAGPWAPPGQRPGSRPSAGPGTRARRLWRCRAWPAAAPGGGNSGGGSAGGHARPSPTAAMAHTRTCSHISSARPEAAAGSGVPSTSGSELLSLSLWLRLELPSDRLGSLDDDALLRPKPRSLPDPPSLPGCELPSGEPPLRWRRCARAPITCAAPGAMAAASLRAAADDPVRCRTRAATEPTCLRACH
jgi:hypothetical protein